MVKSFLSNMKGAKETNESGFKKMHKFLFKRMCKEFVFYKDKDIEFLKAQMLKTDMDPIIKIFTKYRPSHYFKKVLKKVH